MNKYVDKSIELTETLSEKTEVGKIKDIGNTVEITKNEFLQMAIGYTTTEHLPIKLGKDNTIGKCKLCGAGTNAVERCICYECHGKHIKSIYEAIMEADLQGKSIINYKY